MSKCIEDKEGDRSYFGVNETEHFVKVKVSEALKEGSPVGRYIRCSQERHTRAMLGMKWNYPRNHIPSIKKGDKVVIFSDI